MVYDKDDFAASFTPGYLEKTNKADVLFADGFESGDTTKRLGVASGQPGCFAAD